jgi:RHS repeat-associated protein
LQPWNTTFSYDVWGNRSVSSTLPLSVLTPTNEAQFSTSTNRLVEQSTGVALPKDAYDYAGNLQDYPVLGLGTMSYDAENRMTKFTAFGSSNVTTFAYDADGRRVLKSDTGTSNTVTTSVYDAMGQLAAEYSTGSGTVATTYLTDDSLGSTRLITSGTAPATVVQRLDYFPFGENINLPDSTGNSNAVFANRNLVASYNASTVDPLQFTGKERDTETTLDYFGARYFSSAQGRFTSPDNPLIGQNPSNPQSWNLYSYSLNNPLRYVDPTGHDPDPGDQPGCDPQQCKEAGRDFAKAIQFVSGPFIDGYNYTVGLANLFLQLADLQTIPDVQKTPTEQAGSNAFVVGSIMLDMLGNPVSTETATPSESGVAPNSVFIDANKYPESAEHILDAQGSGQPSVLTLDRAGASARRSEALAGTPPVPGKDRDEYPAAAFAEGGRGASVRAISPSDNRGAGASMGNQMRGLSTGDNVRIVVTTILTFFLR